MWKALVGVAMLVLLRSLVDEVGAPGWLLGITAVPVLASAVAEVVYAVGSGALMVATVLCHSTECYHHR